MTCSRVRACSLRQGRSRGRRQAPQAARASPATSLACGWGYHWAWPRRWRMLSRWGSSKTRRGPPPRCTSGAGLRFSRLPGHQPWASDAVVC